MGSQKESDTTERLSTHTHILSFPEYTQPFQIGAFFFNLVTCIEGEGNGTPLQSSCLENPIDRGAWKAAVHGVAKSRHD